MKIFILLIFMFQSINYTQFLDSGFLLNGPLYLPFDRQGVLADVNVSPYGSLMQWENTPIIFSAGFFLTGIYNNNVFIEGVASGMPYQSYSRGKVNNITDPRNVIYSIKKSDTPFGEEWIAWQNAVRNGAYYYDGDGNGEFNPIDHNMNGQWDLDEDRPDLMYDQTYFTVYNDEWPGLIPRGLQYERKGIEIRQTIFGNSAQFKDQTIFIRYSIVNSGLVADTLKDIVFSIWVDADIGYYMDDLIGCDTTLNSAYTYNNGPDSLFGEHAPALYYTFVQGPYIKTNEPSDTAFNNFGTLIGIENRPGYRNGKLASHTTASFPKINAMHGPSIQDVRELAVGETWFGELYDICSDSTHSKLVDVNCENVNRYYWFSGDPVKQTGWLNIDYTDQRQYVNTEKFNLIKDQPQDLIVAYTAARGYNNIHSITVARDIVKSILDDYENNFPDSYSVPLSKQNYPNVFTLSQNYPNPFNPTTTIKFSVPNVGTSRDLSLRTKLIVYDVLGRVVKTLVNEVKAPGSYEVTFDASQLSSGVYFYKLQSGSFIQTKKMMLIK